MKKGKEEQRAGEQTGNLSFQSLLTGSGCGRPSTAESLLRGHFDGAVVRGGGEHGQHPVFSTDVTFYGCLWMSSLTQGGLG